MRNEFRVQNIPTIEFGIQKIIERALKTIHGVNDSKGFLNAKVKVTFTLNDRDDADDFSKSTGQKPLPLRTKVLIQEDLSQDPLI